MGTHVNVMYLPYRLNAVIYFEENGKVCCGRVEAINYRETLRPENEVIGGK